MTNIPLIQGNSVQEINTSIIAIKKAQKELELLNRQVDEKIKALNFALIGGDGKYIQSIEQSAGLIKAIEGNISDSVASGDSNPVTSGGVYTALQEYNPVNTIAYGNNKAVTSNAVANVLCYSTSGRTLTGPALQSGIIIRVMFTAQQTGSNTTTAFTITYNGTAYTVKAPKNGALSNFVASNVSGSYIYCQAYTTLEMMFDGTQFVIVGNPVVISNADYTIYTDGSMIYQKNVDWLCQKVTAPYISTSNNTYLSFKINVSDMTGYIVARLYLRIRNSIRLIYVGTNDMKLFLAQKQITESGFISELKYSASEQKVYVKIYNYPGQPRIYFEHQGNDDVSISNITHSTTPYTLPSDAANIASVL